MYVVGAEIEEITDFNVSHTVRKSLMFLGNVLLERIRDNQLIFSWPA